MVLPKQLQNPNFRFVKIVRGEKRPVGNNWQILGSGNNYTWDEPAFLKWLEDGGSYGIMTGVGGLNVVDADTLELQTLVEKELPKTFTILSGSQKGKHYYFFCHDIQARIVIQENGGTHYGEVQSLGQQVVCPGSLHPSGNYYKVQDDIPIATVTKTRIDSIIKMLIPKYLEVPKISQEAHKKENIDVFGKIESIIPTAGMKSTQEGYQGAHPIHGSETGANFCVNVSANTFYCFRCNAGGGLLQAVAMMEGIVVCGERLRGDKFKAACKVAQEKYGLKIEGLEQKYDLCGRALSFEVKTASRVIVRIDEMPFIGDLYSDTFRKKILKETKITNKDAEKILLEKYNAWKSETKKEESKEKSASAPQEAENKKFDKKRIVERAENILNGTDPEHKDPLKFVLDNFKKLHVGDEAIGKLLAVSVGAQSVDNSAGIQPKLSGGSGKGKTHACKAFLHLVPDIWKRETTLSNKAVFYMDLKPGEIVFSDDISLTEELEGVVKRAATNFQEDTRYTTIDANREVMMLSIPPRISWWLTSVEDVQSLQMLNRQYGENINENSEQDKLVREFQAKKAVVGERDFEMSEDVLVCREIINHVKSQNTPVVVQFADKLEWRDISNRRNFPIFLDMIKSFAIWRFKQRLYDGKKLIADVQDYEDAKSLYCARAENQGTKLNDSELRCCRAIMEVGEIEAKKLQQGLGITQGSLHVLIHGRKDRPESGLVNKVRGLVCETRNEAIDDLSRTNRNYYSLSGFSAIDAFKAVVDFPEEARDAFEQYKCSFTARGNNGNSEEIENGNLAKQAGIPDKQEKPTIDKPDNNPSIAVNSGGNSLLPLLSTIDTTIDNKNNTSNSTIVIIDKNKENEGCIEKSDEQPKCIFHDCERHTMLKTGLGAPVCLEHLKGQVEMYFFELKKQELPFSDFIAIVTPEYDRELLKSGFWAENREGTRSLQ